MNSLNETEKRKLSHSLEETMFSCTFNAQPCDANDFVFGVLIPTSEIVGCLTQVKIKVVNERL